MKERLENLRKTLGLQWKDLAGVLGISVPMLGCLRRGERNPSEKLLARIAEVESGRVVLHKKTSTGSIATHETDKARHEVDAIKKLLGIERDEDVMPKICELVQWKMTEQDRIIKLQRDEISAAKR